MKIALIGDHDPTATAYRAILGAITLGAEELGIEAGSILIGTESIEPDAGERLATFSGIWCVPASVTAAQFPR